MPRNGIWNTPAIWAADAVSISSAVVPNWSWKRWMRSISLFQISLEPITPSITRPWANNPLRSVSGIADPPEPEENEEEDEEK